MDFGESITLTRDRIAEQLVGRDYELELVLSLIHI